MNELEKLNVSIKESRYMHLGFFLIFLPVFLFFRRHQFAYDAGGGVDCDDVVRIE